MHAVAAITVATCYNCVAQIQYYTIRYDTRCYFNVRSKADMSRLNQPHGNDNKCLILPINSCSLSER